MYPGLSTCELPLKAIGEKCADLMIKEIEKKKTGKKTSQVISVPCKLVLRDSIANP